MDIKRKPELKTVFHRGKSGRQRLLDEKTFNYFFLLMFNYVKLFEKQNQNYEKKGNSVK